MSTLMNRSHIAARVAGLRPTAVNYESLVYDGRRHVSPASLSESARVRTVLVNSLSKSYAMTGWRVGDGLIRLGSEARG